jgi:hypothetical protein
LIKKLLTHDPEKRLGGGETDSEEIKNHPFFKGVNWQDIENKKLEPSYKPEIQDHSDLGNIDIAFLREKPVDSPCLTKLSSK